MCYLCLRDTFQLEMPRTNVVKAKERALELKKILKLVEDEYVCEEGDKVVEILKEEQYKLSRDM
jgi:hypothetical protein